MKNLGVKTYLRPGFLLSKSISGKIGVDHMRLYSHSGLSMPMEKAIFLSFLAVMSGAVNI